MSISRERDRRLTRLGGETTRAVPHPIDATTPLDASGGTPPAVEHPRTLGWLATSALAMGGSNQSLFLMAALIAAHGSGAVPLLVVGLVLAWAALPGWIELVLMWPKRVGGIAATCAEAFRPYSPVLANLTGVCYWWGWIPTCGLTALLSASALHTWYLPMVPVTGLAIGIVGIFVVINLAGVWLAGRVAILIAIGSGALAFGASLIPVVAGTVDWHTSLDFSLETPFDGAFGWITSAMAGLYLIGFAAPAFEAAACHVGETKDPARNVPRAMFASAAMASVYFVILPVVLLGVIGTPGLGVIGSEAVGDQLATALGPTFAPLLGSAAKGAAIWFMVLNMFHGTLQPLAGASRTLSQLSEDGLLPRALARRSRRDVPWVATLITAAMAILFLLTGDPPWLIAAANLTYLIGICLPSIAVWLLRRNAPEMERPYRASRLAINAGVAASLVWLASTVLGFQQYGMPSVLAGVGLAYAGVIFYAWRVYEDRRAVGKRLQLRSLHVKLTGAMVLVLVLDGAGYLMAVNSIGPGRPGLKALLEDIFVAVAILTISVGLVLPGIISHAVGQVARAAGHLASGTLTDLRRGLRALADGDLDEARARVDVRPVEVRSSDELGEMAASFNLMVSEVAAATGALDIARERLRDARDALTAKNAELERWGQELEARVDERTSDLRRARDDLAALATTDPLTGLPNHRALIAAIDSEIERAGRYTHSCALLFLDLDHFKQLNDRHGHAAGDATLRQVSIAARTCLRQVDILGRWGGEEFIILLPETDGPRALATAERVRAAIAGMTLSGPGPRHVTCSVGAAVFPDDAEDRGELLEMADRAMYAAKRMGRNLALACDDAVVGALWDSRVRNVPVDNVVILDALRRIPGQVERRERCTDAHSTRVAAIAGDLAMRIGRSDCEVRDISLAAQLHDVGKVGVADAILRKPGRLSAHDWAVVRGHADVGSDLVLAAPGLRSLAPIIRGHHENWDGSGYPDGLTGEQIPLGARIVAIAEAYATMTSSQSERANHGECEALLELRRCAGTQFDPTLVDVLVGLVDGDDLATSSGPPGRPPFGSSGPSFTATSPSQERHPGSEGNGNCEPASR